MEHSFGQAMWGTAGSTKQNDRTKSACQLSLVAVSFSGGHVLLDLVETDLIK